MSNNDTAKASSQHSDLPMLLNGGVTFRMTGVANRLNRSASAFYRSRFGIGVREWRLILVLGQTEKLTVGDAALAADIDIAASSRALKTLKDEGYLSLETTSSRGRATIARLTDKGRALHTKLFEAGERRAEQITEGISPEELAQLSHILGRMLDNVERMNAMYGIEALQEE